MVVLLGTDLLWLPNGKVSLWGQCAFSASISLLLRTQVYFCGKTVTKERSRCWNEFSWRGDIMSAEKQHLVNMLQLWFSKRQILSAEHPSVFLKESLRWAEAHTLCLYGNSINNSNWMLFCLGCYICGSDIDPFHFHCVCSLGSGIPIELEDAGNSCWAEGVNHVWIYTVLWVLGEEIAFISLHCCGMLNQHQLCLFHLPMLGWIGRELWRPACP